MNEKKDPREHAIAVFIIKLMKGKLTAAEEQYLDNWIMEDDSHMEVFEKLINGPQTEWARAWFSARGIKPRLLKKTPDQWYQPKPDPRELNEFYIGAAVGALGLAIVYLVLHYL